MTTKVLVVNFGPTNIRVIPTQNTKMFEVLGIQQHKEYYVYSGNDLIIEEVQNEPR